MGVKGAAIGTVLAQAGAVATLALLCWRRGGPSASKAPEETALPPEPEQMPPSPPAVPAGQAAEKASTTPARPALRPSMRWLPTRAELGAWTSFGVPLAVGQLARCTTFAQITARATSGALAAAAAHQVR